MTREVGGYVTMRGVVKVTMVWCAWCGQGHHGVMCVHGVVKVTIPTPVVRWYRAEGLYPYGRTLDRICACVTRTNRVRKVT